MREPRSLFSIVYDPRENRPECKRSYQGCRKQIDAALKGKRISEEQHHWLERQLTSAYISNIVFQRRIDRPEFS
ncbi:MAG: hypothetical protein AABY02_04330 [Nanoarchaeota archaeon]